jgi:hypothetical protein
VVSVRPLTVWLAPQWLLIRAARGVIHCDAARSYEFSSPAVRRRFLDRDIRGQDFYPEELLAGLGADITTGELLWHQAPSRKGVSGGATCIVYLGFVVDTVRCTVGVPDAKVEKVLGMAKQLMGCVRRNGRQAQRKLVASLVGVCTSLSLAVPDVRFFFRGLHDGLSASKAASSRRVLLSHTAIREVRHWTGIKKYRPHRPLWQRPVAASWTVTGTPRWRLGGRRSRRGEGHRGSRVCTRSMATGTRRCREQRTSRCWS